LFAKAPIAGRVKTRLQPLLSPHQAASLHDAFVRDALDLLTALPGVDIELHTDTSTDAWNAPGVARMLQVDGDLGIKMHSAADAALGAGRPQVLIAGSDSPTVPAAHFDALLRSAADVTIGPADDESFYAIAFRRTHPDMFADVVWSSSDTRQAMAAACRACGLSVDFGPRGFAIDSAAGLIRLLSDPSVRRNTAAWFARYGPAIAERLACMKCR
jgi:glycosyltransferase A (GT-A) superfamily protein (DUF2064 family)